MSFSLTVRWLWFSPLALMAVFSSCKKMEAYDKDLTIIKVSELNSAKVSDRAIVKLLKEELNANVTIRYTLSEDTAFQELREGDVDFAIIPNNAFFKASDIRTVAPLLPRMLAVMTMNIKDYPPGDFRELMQDHHVVFEDLSRFDSIFMQKLFMSFGIDPASVRGLSANRMDLDQWKDSAFVYLGLTHLHNPKMKKLVLMGAHFFSLDDVSLYQRGSSVEGFRMNFSRVVPFILPKDFFLGKPTSPVLTISIPDVLVTRKDVSRTLVYDIVSLLVEQKPQLEEMDNIYALLQTRDFNEDIFSFPLHNGTVDFITRNQPSLLTRYASVILTFISILAILAGALASIHRRMKMSKKLRIELFYRKLLSLRKKVLKNMDDNTKKEMFEELRELRSEAFDALLEDRLVADESFEIFLALYDEVRREIQQ